MKRKTLLKHLRRYGCYLKREGRSHSLWCNPLIGHAEAVPRHTEIPDKLVKKICLNLSIPEVKKRVE
ncbi:MAG: type II toxin-antitoxin system HicA family toxin [Candidatus Aminicenantes bacterium]